MIHDPLHSRKQTWNPKMEGWKMMFLFIRGDFQVPAVSFRGSRVYLQGNKWVLLCISTSQIFRVKTFLEFTTYKFWGMCQHLGPPSFAGTRRKCLLVKHRKPSGDQNNSTVWLHFFWQSPPIYVIIHLINKTSNHAPWDNYTKACILAFPNHLCPSQLVFTIRSPRIPEVYPTTDLPSLFNLGLFWKLGSKHETTHSINEKTR